MAGHSKWANIKHRKNAQDAKRGKIFTKLIREITVSAKIGGGLLETNPRLRTVMDKALAQNMTRDTIDRAIKRGVGSGDEDNLEEIRYEGYGPYGVAIMVDCLTDNRNRTVAEVRHAFSKAGGNLGQEGSVAYLFSKKGQIVYAPQKEEGPILELAIEAGADDVEVQEDKSIEITTTPDTFDEVLKNMQAISIVPEMAEVTVVPQTLVPLEGEAAAEVQKMLDALEDLDDVQEVYSNADFPEDI